MSDLVKLTHKPSRYKFCEERWSTREVDHNQPGIYRTTITGGDYFLGMNEVTTYGYHSVVNVILIYSEFIHDSGLVFQPTQWNGTSFAVCSSMVSTLHCFIQSATIHISLYVGYVRYFSTRSNLKWGNPLKSQGHSYRYFSSNHFVRKVLINMSMTVIVELFIRVPKSDEF